AAAFSSFFFAAARSRSSRPSEARPLPARCRFYPSCSAYALEAVAVHGAIRGAGLTARRLLRCHPFHPGGHDPVPEPGGRRRADVTGA
ncbi:membrane protein insertion efficiency factor YidD, partial [Nonomuraea sp. NPDC049141]|uniref:membrane protein insertion efficiency factor YidD n=1 Tax=Nonomuraea sp. NPDC049141 TaxID=3155500 RepID=UPI0034009AE0